jgi:hypothetical protein
LISLQISWAIENGRPWFHPALRDAGSLLKMNASKIQQLLML